MASYSTAYLVIPKQKASREITAKINDLEIFEENSDEIKLGYNGKGFSPSENWRVSLYDYKFEGEKVETPDGSIETGIVGTKMNYHNKYNTEGPVKNAISEYIETG